MKRYLLDLTGDHDRRAVVIDGPVVADLPRRVDVFCEPDWCVSSGSGRAVRATEVACDLLCEHFGDQVVDQDLIDALARQVVCAALARRYCLSGDEIERWLVGWIYRVVRSDHAILEGGGE